MKRKTYRRLRAVQQPGYHHSVYVVLLKPAVARVRTVCAANLNRDPKKPCVYVGMTGLTPEERFENHQQGIESAGVDERFGLRLMPELFVHLNPMPFDAALQMNTYRPRYRRAFSPLPTACKSTTQRCRHILPAIFLSASGTWSSKTQPARSHTGQAAGWAEPLLLTISGKGFKPLICDELRMDFARSKIRTARRIIKDRQH